jgi:hypothetical protein
MNLLKIRRWGWRVHRQRQRDSEYAEISLKPVLDIEVVRPHQLGADGSCPSWKFYVIKGPRDVTRPLKSPSLAPEPLSPLTCW